MKKSELELWLDRPLRDVLMLLQWRSLNVTKWFGVGAIKNPLDFWVYQEIIFEQKPDIIVEVGNYNGGSTLALAHLCDLLGHGRVIGLDINHRAIPPQVRNHPRITLIEGDACNNYSLVARECAGLKVLVIEDSSHTYENTLNVLRTFSPLVSRGGYFIVEDSNCHHGIPVGPSPGPHEAIEEFLKTNDKFEVDSSRESFLITWNPNGFLKRKA